MKILLPRPGSLLEEYELSSREPLYAGAAPSPTSRVAYAAAHVVVDPLATVDPIGAPLLDMDATLAYRRYLWSLGFHVAEAMDTAQRGMGLTWQTAQTLIRHSCAEARSQRGIVACGANTDQLDPLRTCTIEDVIAAYEEQCAFIEEAGGRVILMASRALAKCAGGPEGYMRVYGRLLSQLSQPAILHWLGEAFDPALRGYWGGQTVEECMDVCLEIIATHHAKVDGVKISLLSAQREIDMRRRLPEGVKMYTGDDFNYPELIEGDALGYSDALLGIFDPIAPAAALALRSLDANDHAGYHEVLDPTLALSRCIFEAPTYHYKTGVVFLAYLNGHQNHFRMVAGQESARSIVHLASLFMHADRARLLRDPEMAVFRMGKILSLAGVEAGGSHVAGAS
jgi:hypothetical protein